MTAAPATEVVPPRTADVQRSGRGVRAAQWAGIALTLAGWTAFVLLVCRSISPTFFLIDDAQNEFLPYFHEMGRQWLSGQVPIMTTRTFFGGNFFISIERAALAPQTILVSILAAKTANYVLVALAFAGLNIALSSVGGFLAGRALSIPRRYSLFIGFAISALPIFLYMYTASWWNGSIGSTWLVFAVAALLRAVVKPSPWSFVAALVTSVLVLISGWPHAIAGLLVIGAALALSRIEPRRLLGSLPGVLRIVAPVALAGLISAFVFSEYLVEGSNLDRVNQISNPDNFCVPTLDQVAGIFNPVAGSYWSCYGGYGTWPFPIGFVALASLPALTLWRPRRGDRVVWALVGAAVALAVLTQLPSNLISIRYPFRFLPILGVVIAILTFSLIGRGERVFTRKRLLLAGLLLLVSAATGVARYADVTFRMAGFAALVVALIVGMAVVAHRWSRLLPAALAVLAVVGVLLVGLQGKGLGGPYLLYNDPPGRGSAITAAGDDALDRGFVAITQMPNDLADVGSARSLLLGWRSFNGYDPVGQRAYIERFGNRMPQGFYTEELLTQLGASRDLGGARVCDFELYGVRSVIAARTLDSGPRSALERCGFTEVETRGDSALWASDAPAVTGTLSYWTGQGNPVSDLESERRESVTVESGGSLYFARMFWSGYTATLDGAPLPVSSDDGILVRVDVPEGSSGRVVLDYTPRSWKWSLPLSGAALLAAIGIIAWPRSRRWLSEPISDRASDR